jgi:hypothetical protein
MQTLEELKAANAAEEAEAQGTEVTATQAVEEYLDVAPEIKAESSEPVLEESEAAAEGEGENGEGDLEAWQQTGEESGGKKFTDSDIGAVKKKLRSKLEREHSSEVEQLREEINTLKSGSTTPSTVPTTKAIRPKYEDYDDEDEYNGAMDNFQDARLDERMSNRDNHLATQSQQRDATQRLEESVDGHYERAAKLTQDSGISSEVYRSADNKVRQAVERIRPNGGDAAVEYLISSLGEGSEKVMYFLGRNDAALSEFTGKLLADPTGMSAAIYLGQKKSELTNPSKQKNRAPKPATQIKGDSGGNVSSANLKAAYQKADKAGNTQARFDARKAARASGVDVSNW